MATTSIPDSLKCCKTPIFSTSTRQRNNLGASLQMPYYILLYTLRCIKSSKHESIRCIKSSKHTSVPGLAAYYLLALLRFFSFRAALKHISIHDDEIEPPPVHSSFALSATNRPDSLIQSQTRMVHQYPVARPLYCYFCRISYTFSMKRVKMTQSK